MAHINQRLFGQICLGVAKGEDVSELLAAWRINDPEYVDLIRTSHSNKVLPLAAAALHQVGVALPSNLPSPSFWVSQNLYLRTQLLQLDKSLNERNAQVLLLKGGIQLFRSAYVRPGMRTMSDLDILIKDAAVLTCFSELGYGPSSPSDKMPTSLDLEPGAHHLTPIKRPQDIVTIELHVLPASVENAHLVGDLWVRAELPQGLKATYIPHPVDQLILSVVHAMRHDRNSMHGGLFMRSLVECELLYASLSRSQQQEACDLLRARGALRMWTAWRGFADWCFLNDDAAATRSIATRLLVKEHELRSRSRSGALLASVAHLLVNFTSRDFLTSGRVRYFTKKIFDASFWSRFAQKLRSPR
jgi:hypothetical protein